MRDIDMPVIFTPSTYNRRMTAGVMAVVCIWVGLRKEHLFAL